MDIVVQHAELLAGPRGEGLWKISMDVIRDGKPDRTAAIVPADAIEWRVAQFNVDARTALEMILLEPYLAKDQDHRSFELMPTRSAARQGKLAAMQQVLGGGSITSPVGAPAWRVGDLEGEPTKLLDSGKGDALKTVLAESPIDDQIIEVKRQYLDRARARTRAASTELAPPPIKDDVKVRRPGVEELRSRLRLEPDVTAESSGPADTRRGREA